ncbi:MAG TPA: hypothetical protein VGO30_25925 [Mycobacterium sp.]|nr:hypothetical protein [Mycobacterium sp.]
MTVSVRVSVTVLVLVLVLMLGVVVVVVVEGVVDVVVGSVVVVVSVAVSLGVPVAVGSGATAREGVVTEVDEVVVTVSEVEESPAIRLIKPYTTMARMIAATAPSATSAAGFRYQGCSGGGSGEAGWP